MLSLSFTLGASAACAATFNNAIGAFSIPYFSRCELYSSSNNIRLVDV
jgi:hypothetical protein